MVFKESWADQVCQYDESRGKGAKGKGGEGREGFNLGLFVLKKGKEVGRSHEYS